ncbi:MAG: hypothetical protein SVW77_03895, partial [Candidatus Nanohaloarchaea archaeon]|nr:hypothetical protein [Candidatus Nanohaloarchaea archaeon]
ERVAYADYLTGEGVPDLEVPEAVQRRRAASVAADGGGAYAFPDAVTVHRLEPVDGDGAAVSADGVVVEWEDRPYLVTLDGETAPRGTRNGHRAVPVTARDIDASGGTYTTRNGVTEEGVKGFVDKVWEQERLHIPLRDGGD